MGLAETSLHWAERETSRSHFMTVMLCSSVVLGASAALSPNAAVSCVQERGRKNKSLQVADGLVVRALPILSFLL